ncbi:MAG: hypothetical protein LN408_04500 [Candidatus Thermoplasmatota archaeon]|nr:hypothetical protein [Candidatus Thermoplasmatota archaeon]
MNQDNFIHLDNKKIVDDRGGNNNKIATWTLKYQWRKYLSYKSFMNYSYTYKIIDFSNGNNGNNDSND